MGKSIFGLKRLTHLSKGEEQSERDTMDIVPLIVESILEDERQMQEIVDEFKQNLDLINVHLKVGSLNTSVEGKTRAEQAEISYGFAVKTLREKIQKFSENLEKY